MTFCLYLWVAALSRFTLISLDSLESQEFVYSHNFSWFKFYCMNKHPFECQLFFIWAIFLFHFVQLCYKWEPDSLAGIISFLLLLLLLSDLKVLFHAFFLCLECLFKGGKKGGEICFCSWTLRNTPRGMIDIVKSDMHVKWWVAAWHWGRGHLLFMLPSANITTLTSLNQYTVTFGSYLHYWL